MRSPPPVAHTCCLCAAQEAPCLTVAASDLSLGVGAGLGAPRLRFLVLDCRREDQVMMQEIVVDFYIDSQ